MNKILPACLAFVLIAFFVSCSNGSGGGDISNGAMNTIGNNGETNSQNNLDPEEGSSEDSLKEGEIVVNDNSSASGSSSASNAEVVELEDKYQEDITKIKLDTQKLIDKVAKNYQKELDKINKKDDPDKPEQLAALEQAYDEALDEIRAQEVSDLALLASDFEKEKKLKSNNGKGHAYAYGHDKQAAKGVINSGFSLQINHVDVFKFNALSGNCENSKGEQGHNQNSFIECGNFANTVVDNHDFRGEDLYGVSFEDSYISNSRYSLADFIKWEAVFNKGSKIETEYNLFEFLFLGHAQAYTDKAIGINGLEDQYAKLKDELSVLMVEFDSEVQREDQERKIASKLLEVKTTQDNINIEMAKRSRHKLQSMYYEEF
jgi:hypothetical protein